MTNNTVKYKVFVKQYLLSILFISESVTIQMKANSTFL